MVSVFSPHLHFPQVSSAPGGGGGGHDAPELRFLLLNQTPASSEGVVLAPV